MAAALVPNDAPLLFHRRAMTGELWNLGMNDIYRWLALAAKQPADWDVDPSQASDLSAIVTQLTSISLTNGVNFNQLPAITPNQHIHRSRNKAWKSLVRTQSKLLVDFTWRHNGLRPGQGPRMQPLSWWSSSDLLGLLLSAMGPAPDGATELNFYLPLLALYGRWCHRISGNRGVNGRTQPGAADPAIVYQCTWNEDTRCFFLGASLSGCVNYPVSEVGIWGTLVKTARFDLLNSFHSLQSQGFTVDGRGYPWKFGSSVNLVIDRETGNQFGNCAETYPFLCMMGQHVGDQAARCRGLALTRDFLPMDIYSQQRLLQQTASPSGYRYLVNPCMNCTFLIRTARGTPQNFWPRVLFRP